MGVVRQLRRRPFPVSFGHRSRSASGWSAYPEAMAEPRLILRVETPDGVFLRPIMPASALAVVGERGPAAEDATRGAAASWGLPDFVFRSTLQRRGSGVRELGDAIVVVGDRAASVQVKARSSVSNSSAREHAWLQKRIAEGVSQAAGTIRSLRSSATTALVNERGRSILVHGPAKTWVPVVVVDHPGSVEFVPGGDAVVLLRQDWEFLFQQLKSTYAVIEYLHRVHRIGDRVPLGKEAVRYYELAAADLAALPDPADTRLSALGLRTQSTPTLPQVPAGHGDDRYQAVVRIVLEDIATTGHVDDAARLNLLAAIDSLPVGYRAELGADILRWMDQVAAVPDPEITWRFRSIVWPGRPYLLFGAATRFSESVQAEFGDYVALRHQQQLELMPERSEALTVGVLLTPRHDGLRPWDTTSAATRGDQGFDPMFREALELLWGPLGTTVRNPDWGLVEGAFKRAARRGGARGAPP